MAPFLGVQQDESGRSPRNLKSPGTSVARAFDARAVVPGDALTASRTEQRSLRSWSRESPNFLPTFKTIVLTSLTTVSVTATMKRSAPVSWSQPSIRLSVNAS